MPTDYKKFKTMDDGRRKIHPKDHEKIRKEYKTGNHSQKSLAIKYNVSKSLIAIILNKKRRDQVKKRIKNHWRDYHDRKALTEATRKLRAKKRLLGLDYNKNPVKKDKRVCPICRKVFYAKGYKIYDSSKCRFKAFRERRKTF